MDRSHGRVRSKQWACVDYKPVPVAGAVNGSG